MTTTVYKPCFKLKHTNRKQSVHAEGRFQFSTTSDRVYIAIGQDEVLRLKSCRALVLILTTATNVLIMLQQTLAQTSGLERSSMKMNNKWLIMTNRTETSQWRMEVRVVWREQWCLLHECIEIPGLAWLLWSFSSLTLLSNDRHEWSTCSDIQNLQYSCRGFGTMCLWMGYELNLSASLFRNFFLFLFLKAAFCEFAGIFNVVVAIFVNVSNQMAVKPSHGTIQDIQHLIDASSSDSGDLPTFWLVGIVLLLLQGSFASVVSVFHCNDWDPWTNKTR